MKSLSFKKVDFYDWKKIENISFVYEESCNLTTSLSRKVYAFR